MTEMNAGLTMRDAMSQAESELAVTAESDGAVTPSDEPVLEPAIEQPAVEKPSEAGVLDSLTEQPEEPEGESGKLYEVNGESLTLDQLIAGNMMHANYTQKTQELADKTREADKAITLLRLLEERPVETVRKLYQQINSNAPISDLVTATEPTLETDQPIASEDINSLVEARVAEMLKNDPRLVQVQQDQALEQVNVIFAEIEEMYDVTLVDSDKQLVLQTAVDLDTDDLKFVFGGLMNQASQKKAALSNAKRVTPIAPEYVPPGDQAPAVPKKFESFRSAVKATLEAEQGNA